MAKPRESPVGGAFSAPEVVLGDVQVITPPGSPRLLPRPLRNIIGESGSAVTPSESQTSEEDYDDAQTSIPIARRRNTRPKSKSENEELDPKEIRREAMSDASLEKPQQQRNGRGDEKPVLQADDAELRDVIRRGLMRVRDPADRGRQRRGFSDLAFTRKFSTFDRQSDEAANSPFHGFFTLFWMAVFFFVVRIGAENWKDYGSPFGANEVMQTMFKRDVVVLLLSDGIMCGLTGMSLILQKLIYSGYLDWDRSGWLIQSLWQAMFIIGTIGLTLLREWPWTHTVFFVLHGIIMLMKQHSYAFYNGYLSTVQKKRRDLLRQLKRLDGITPLHSLSPADPLTSSLSTMHLSHVPSSHTMKKRRASVDQDKNVPDLDMIAAAIESGEPLYEDQVQIFERMIKWEIDAYADELKGKSSVSERAYPNNLTVANHYEYIVLPTVVYELDYPRSSSINWYYAMEKLIACFGIIFVMIMVSQTFMYPVVMRTVKMKEANMHLVDRIKEFPWILSDLLFPFMMEYLLSWYLIWETILNFLAELTYFADRSFYGAWWNSVSWDQFARDWNRPVHNFLLRHVYHSSISAMKVNKHTATLITFFLSACIHELVMWCIFKKLRGYLLILQMCQLPLVRLSRTRWLRHKATLGNIIFWLGIFTGPSVLCSLYLIL